MENVVEVNSSAEGMLLWRKIYFASLATGEEPQWPLKVHFNYGMIHNMHIDRLITKNVSYLVFGRKCTFQKDARAYAAKHVLALQHLDTLILDSIVIQAATITKVILGSNISMTLRTLTLHQIPWHVHRESALKFMKALSFNHVLCHLDLGAFSIYFMTGRKTSMLFYKLGLAIGRATCSLKTLQETSYLITYEDIFCFHKGFCQDVEGISRKRMATRKICLQELTMFLHSEQATKKAVLYLIQILNEVPSLAAMNLDLQGWFPYYGKVRAFIGDIVHPKHLT